MYHQTVDTAASVGGLPTETGDYVVSLDQVPCWSDVEYRSQLEDETESPYFSNYYFSDPLTSYPGLEIAENGTFSRFPVDHEINSKIYLWRGDPWNLEVDAVVNSTNENLDEAHSSPGLHSTAGPGLAEECATMGGCRTGMAKVTNAYDLPARRVIHTIGPMYAVKYHTAAENALSQCYRSCLELLIDCRLQSIAMGCIYTESKNYPREPAAHVAIRTVRRFLEKQKDKIKAIVFCTSTSSDTEVYKRLLPLYFPRDKHEEEVAVSKLPADVGDENGETIIDERKIRIKPLPKKAAAKPPQPPPQAQEDLPVSDVGLVRRNSSYLDSYLDPAFMSLIKDPDLRRKEQWEKTAQVRNGWNCAKLLGFDNLGGPPLSAAEEYSLHARYLSKASSLNLSEIAEMKIIYRGGVDNEGRPVMVVVGAHFLLRCLDLERFVIYVVKIRISRVSFDATATLLRVRGMKTTSLDCKGKVAYVNTDLCPNPARWGALLRNGMLTTTAICTGLYGFSVFRRLSYFAIRRQSVCILGIFNSWFLLEFEPLIKKPYIIVYFHSAASLQVQPDLEWMWRLQQILGRKHQHNLHAMYILHPTFHLKATVLAMQILMDNVVWKKVVYVDRLLQLFRYVPREQLTIPDFVFQLRHDLEVNGGKGLIVDPRTKYVYQRP